MTGRAQKKPHRIRLGLCCQFRDEPIKFRNTTVRHVLGLSREARLEKMAGLCRANAEALRNSIVFCAENGIGAFRVNSQILPLKSHDEAGYAMEELPGGDDIVELFQECGALARKHDIRLSMHPDQFILLSSSDANITRRAIAELEYHGAVCEWIGADVINIHGGGAYGDKASALDRVAWNLQQLAPRVRERLTLENDDRTYTPVDLLPLCKREGVPLVYDVHHHRCLPDGLSEDAATEEAIETWNREPMFHISSPIAGWHGPKPQRHHGFINITDFPECWRSLDATVEVEAKAKEVAVLELMNALQPRYP